MAAPVTAAAASAHNGDTFVALTDQLSKTSERSKVCYNRQTLLELRAATFNVVFGENARATICELELLVLPATVGTAGPSTNATRKWKRHRRRERSSGTAGTAGPSTNATRISSRFSGC